jgi:quercetin dioxygenase-like cupin family protein
MTSTPFNFSSEGDIHENEPDGIADDLVLGFVAHSLRENDYDAFEQSLSAGDAALTVAIREWDQVIEELSLALPPVTPNPRILTSLLARIGAQQEAAGSVNADIELNDEDPAVSAGPILTTKDGEHRSLIIRRGTRSDWRSAGSPGVRMRILNFDRRQGRTTYLLQIDAGASYPEHLHHADEECYMISGDIQDGELKFVTGDYFLAPAGSHHGTLTTIEGCVCLISTAIPIKM